jgi:hypothetical protein
MFNQIQLQVPHPGAARPRIGERRQCSRVKCVYRVGMIRTARAVGLCRITNISDGGAMLRSNMGLKRGDRLTLSLSEAIALPAKVAWSAAGACGISFDEEIDCLDVLHRSYQTMQARSYRPHRLEVEQDALASAAGSTVPVTIHNVSQRGMKLSPSARFEPGMGIKVRTQSGRERRGIVRWTKEGDAGVWLLDPYAPEELSSTALL